MPEGQARPQEDAAEYHDNELLSEFQLGPLEGWEEDLGELGQLANL